MFRFRFLLNFGWAGIITTPFKVKCLIRLFFAHQKVGEFIFFTAASYPKAPSTLRLRSLKAQLLSFSIKNLRLTRLRIERGSLVKKNLKM